MPPKLTIITPCYRIHNLDKIKNSINFDYLDEWIIVYDESKILENPKLFRDYPQIKEYLHTSTGIYGHPQRNYALSKITKSDTLLFYLDDDNIVHPDLFHFISTINSSSKIYTFNQEGGLRGNIIQVGFIDTAMILISFDLVSEIRWVVDKYEADGIYIEECVKQNMDNHVYVDRSLCYYNKLNQNTSA
jgi:hypothetical protein